MIFLEYTKCSTCIKAKKYLISNNIDFTDRHIIDSNPSYDELKLWYDNSDIDINRMFNTSGKVYKELGLSKKLKEMSTEDKLKLLSSDGKLIKRPLIIENDRIICLGFKEEEYSKLL